MRRRIIAARTRRAIPHPGTPVCTDPATRGEAVWLSPTLEVGGGVEDDGAAPEVLVTVELTKGVGVAVPSRDTPESVDEEGVVVLKKVPGVVPAVLNTAVVLVSLI